MGRIQRGKEGARIFFLFCQISCSCDGQREAMSVVHAISQFQFPYRPSQYVRGKRQLREIMSWTRLPSGLVAVCILATPVVPVVPGKAPGWFTQCSHAYRAVASKAIPRLEYRRPASIIFILPLCRCLSTTSQPCRAESLPGLSRPRTHFHLLFLHSPPCTTALNHSSEPTAVAANSWLITVLSAYRYGVGAPAHDRSAAQQSRAEHTAPSHCLFSCLSPFRRRASLRHRPSSGSAADATDTSPHIVYFSLILKNESTRRSTPSPSATPQIHF